MALMILETDRNFHIQFVLEKLRLCIYAYMQNKEKHGI